MPTYQYSCTECGGRLRKVFNAVGVVFKCSGFYRNDSRSQKAGSETASTNGSEGGSESKPKKEGESTPSTAKSESTSGKSESSSGTPSTPAATG